MEIRGVDDEEEKKKEGKERKGKGKSWLLCFVGVSRAGNERKEIKRVLGLHRSIAWMASGSEQRQDMLSCVSGT